MSTHQPKESAQRGMRLSRVLLAFALGLAILLATAAGYVAWIAAQAPTVKALQATRPPEPSVILSADGQVLARVQASRLEPLPLARISPFVVHALIATEDHRFREHDGVDWAGTARALVHTLAGRVEGGSTITQQLARNLFPDEIGRSRSLDRKIREIVTARRIERLHDKDRILEAYLNTVPFLYNTTGIGAAARTYFGKSASDLDVLESATLVGMLKGTHHYNPVRHPERSRERRNQVLALMHEHGGLGDGADLAALQAAPLVLNFGQGGDEPRGAPHFVAHVRRSLEDWAERTQHDLERDGLVVHTTLDARLQALAEAAVTAQTDALQQVADVEWSREWLAVQSRSPAAYAAAARRLPAFDYFWRTRPALLHEALRKTDAYRALRRAGRDDAAALAAVAGDPHATAEARGRLTRLEAGFVALDPVSGAVRAWVGSRDHAIDQFDHVAQAARQSGSTFKPIVYAAALEQGASPFRTYLDAPVEIPLGDGRVWRPTDLRGSSYAPMTLWEGLVLSKNTVTVQVMQEAGLERVGRLARDMGITQSRLDLVPSMALGTSAVTLLEMASVYATIAERGRHREPFVVERITDRRGRVVAEFGPAPARQVLSRDTADKLLDILRGVVTQGTGGLLRARYVREADVAGKTGTTQNNTDGWFIAMHPQIVAGAWVGFNDPRVTMRSDYWGQGGHNALRLVGDFMARALEAGRLDANQTFASPSLPRLMASGDWSHALPPTGAGPPAGEGLFEDRGEDGEQDGKQDGEESGEEGGDAGGWIADPVATAASGTPMSAEELGRALRAMGRDPETGEPLEGPAPPASPVLR